jgi:hypothetical protein
MSALKLFALKLLSPKLRFALKLSALNCGSPQLCLRYDYDYDDDCDYGGQQVYEGAGFGQFQQQMARDQRF